MIDRLIDRCLSNRALVLLAWLLLIVAGLWTLPDLPVDAVPDVTNIQVQVLTNAPGLAPEEVERFITFPVEVAMSGLPHLEEVRSVSKFGLSLVTIVFEDGTDIYWARQLVGERMAVARDEIPEGYGDPEMGPISTGLGEIYQFEVRGKGYTPMELRSLLDWSINFQLRSVPGVVEVNSMGGMLKTYQVTLDPAKLRSRGVSASEVIEAIQRNNRNVGGGYLTHQGEQYLIRGEGLVEHLEDLGSIVVRVSDGIPIYVKDLGTPEFAPMIRQGAVTRDGKGEAVIGIVMMLMGANSRAVVHGVKEKIEAIRKTLPAGVEIDTFYDRTELVDLTIRTVATNLAEGAFLVLVVLILLIGNPRAAFLVASSIPISFLGAVLGMRWMGISANLMSLGALDFGIIADGSVVMIENIVRILHERRDDTGATLLEKVRAASHEVARPTAFSVLIIMIVYLPILGLRGIEGKLFQPMAWTVVFALATALACALTLMPVLASFVLTTAEHEEEPWLFRLAQRIYRPLFCTCHEYPRATLGTAAALVLVAAGLTATLGAEFIPRLGEGSIAMQIWRLPSISLEESNRISIQAETVLRAEFPEIKTILSRTGRAEIATDPMGVEVSDTFIMLRPPSTWRFGSKEELIEAMDRVLDERVPGAVFSYSQPIELRLAELISGVRSDVAVKIYGDDIDEMKRKADQTVAVLSHVPGAADVKAEQTVGLPMLRVRIDRAAVARYGLNCDDVLTVVEALGGKPIGVIIEGQRRFQIQVRFAESVRANPEQIARILVAPREGGRQRAVTLGQVAEISLEDGPAQISRENISRRITVECNVRGRDLASFVAEAKSAVDAKVKLPPGWNADWGGQFENLQAASGRLAVLVPLALFLIATMIFMAYGSVGDTLRVFSGVPFAAVGGTIALWLRGIPLSISAGIGFVTLSGVSVLGYMILVSTVRLLLERGVELPQAVEQAAFSRLRPVLMTALVASLGFLPMALSSSMGAEVQRPLATVVIGGVVSSTALTLLVLPVLYLYFEARKNHQGEARD